MLKITILTDKTSWMNKYNLTLQEYLTCQGHEVRLIDNKIQLQKGDIAFFLSCFEIIKKEKLALNRHNIVVHASNLPSGKGWSPASWQILEGKDSIPLTLFEADEKVDAGKIYMQDSVLLDGSELISEWQEKMGKKIVEMCISFVSSYPSIIQTGKEQTGVETFYAKRSPVDSKLDIHQSIANQFNLLRIVDNENYPAFFEMKGKKYILKIYGDQDV